LNRIDRVLELALGLAFLTAGILKVLDPAEFAVSLAGLRLLPPGLIGATAILLPWVEIVAGLALIATRRYRDAAEWLLLGLLALFTLILAVSMARVSAGSCGCFGSGIAILNRPDVGLARNAILIAVAAALIVRRRRSLTSGRSGPASPA
jgi:uncharacterized membrane protein YphA (DoxX/SURF4 family)